MNHENKNILIIGGGLTGLTAAYNLVNKGYKITILEKSGNLGGLAAGFKIHGESIEKAYHHFFESDNYLINFLKQLDLEKHIEWKDSSIGLYYNKKLYPFGGATDLLKFNPLSIFQRLRTGIVIFYLSKFKFAKNSDKVKAYSWLQFWSGKKSYEVIWKPLLKGKFHEYYKEIALPWLWARFFTRASSRNLLEKEQLGYIEGGFQIFIDRLVQVLLNLGVEINMNSSIERIYNQEEQVLVEINGEVKVFDKVIATVPSNVFLNLVENLDEKYSNKLKKVEYLGAISLVFSSSQKISDYYWNNINDLNSPFLAFINHTNLISKERYDGKYIYYLGKYVPNDSVELSKNDATIISEWFSYLKKIFPEFEENQVIEKHIFKFKNAQHIVTTSYKENIPEYETPLKNIYLSNFSQIYPEDRGTNFAVREGEKIAKLVVSS